MVAGDDVECYFVVAGDGVGCYFVVAGDGVGCYLWWHVMVLSATLW